MKEALYYESLEGDKVQCLLCPHECVIAEGRKGLCNVRVNEGGTLYSEVYNQAMATSMDPVEKKPLYHFHPGSPILSLGTRGCNLRCEFCQNWHMWQPDARTGEITSEYAVREAAVRGSMGIAYTYNEPAIWYEFVLECSQSAGEKGLANVLVTNGFISPQPFARLAPLIDAMNIDIKSMDPGFYREICKAERDPVLDICKAAREAGIHIEITNLVIPTLNDSDELISELVEFVAGLGPEVPLHFSAYHPAYKMTIEATPLSALERAKGIAEEKLDYVYIGNVAVSDGANTYCPDCGNLLVRRRGFGASMPGIEGDKCGSCGRKADIVL